MKVVMSAYACDPQHTSERGVGWWWACAAAEHHQVWLLTRERSRPAIERALKADPRPNLHPVYVDLPQWARWWKRGTAALVPYYCLWQIAAFWRIRRLHQLERFDVAHHVTFATDWLPAGAVFVGGLPSVWGPVGPGITSFPVTLTRALGQRWAVTEGVRALGTSIASRVMGAPTARRASVILAQNREVARRYAGHPHLEIEQNAVVDVPPSARGLPAGDNGFRRQAVFVGRLIPWKGLRIAILALACPEASNWNLDIIGTGPERAPVAALARRLGVEHRVTWRGAVDRHEVFKALSEADALLFPSVHESAGAVVAEAVSAGCPVVCFDRGGPGAMIRAGEGQKVPLGGDVAGSFATALAQVSGRHAGSDRWRGARLSPLLDRLYEAAVAGPERTAR